MSSNYNFVDVFYANNGVTKPWKRIHIDGLSNFQYEEAKNFNCFATVQRFASLTRAEEEQHIAPLWVDIDNEELAISRQEAIRVVDFLNSEIKVPKESISIYFSGKKGFHIFVSEKVLDIKPASDLHKTAKLIAQFLVYKLDAHSIDLVVYNKKRMMRLDGSRHHETKKYKIQLTFDELHNFDENAIIELASKPREQIQVDDSFCKEASAFYSFYAQQKDLLADMPTSDENTEFVFTKDRFPVCVQNLMAGGWKKEGDRNYATVNLAIFFRDAGYTELEAINYLVEWVRKFTSAKTNYEIELRVQSTKNVIRAVYSIPTYRFGCAMIRSLHGEKSQDSDEYDRVPCAGSLCEFLKTNDVEQNDATLIHLTKSGNAKYYNKLIKTNVMVAGKKDTPYIVPHKIEYSCHGACKKKGCPLYSVQGNLAYKNLSSSDNDLLKMCSIPHNVLQTFLKDISARLP